jgi:hypothetical protein
VRREDARGGNLCLEARPNIRGGITIERDLPAETKLWLTGWTETIGGGELVSVLVERPNASRARAPAAKDWGDDFMSTTPADSRNDLAGWRVRTLYFEVRYDFILMPHVMDVRWSAWASKVAEECSAATIVTQQAETPTWRLRSLYACD